MTMKRDIEFLYEASAFRFVDRTWKHFLYPGAANNAEHAFRVAWIALTLARMEKVRDHEKVLKMALIHDLAESRCGDVNYVQRQYVTRDEHAAIGDMLADTIHEEDMREVLREYEERKTKAAQVVKDADNLDVDLELREAHAQGIALRDLWKENRDTYLPPKLYTASAKKLRKALVAANPHDWHFLAPRNRFRGGDWKKR